MTDREYREWVASLAPGDEVTLEGYDSVYKSATVLRLTPKQLVLRDERGREYRYWRDHERWVGYSARGSGIGRLRVTGDPSRRNEPSVVSRPCDMSPDGYLELIRQDDGDVILTVRDPDEDGVCGVGSVEFCEPGTGGGASPRTHAALVALIDAMRADDEHERGGPVVNHQWAVEQYERDRRDPVLRRYAFLSSYTPRSDAEEVEVVGLREYLRHRGDLPDWEIVPREDAT